MGKHHSGGCLCGDVRYQFSEPIYGCVNCHCESCRKNCAAPMTTFVGVYDGTWRWTGAAPSVFESSPGVKRYFCGRCGSPVAYISENFTNKMHFYLAQLDDPEAFKPEGHSFKDSQLSWLHLADDKPDTTGKKWSKKAS
ncbi:MAG: GFA family protein [Alphaproteobacteria bacterium]|nr:GFA family protein [Alphaproteobacteria bacterium]